MTKSIGVLLGMLSLFACSGNEWTRGNNGSEADFEQDQSACSAFSQEVGYDKTGHLTVWADERRVRECLEKRGWSAPAQPED